MESPSRLNPNQVLLREREGAPDQMQEEAYRRETYMIFKKNLEEAFNEFNVNNDEYLQRDEFNAFMRSSA
jgi:Ca2+-binding EF-hand superfamily protein